MACTKICSMSSYWNRTLYLYRYNWCQHCIWGYSHIFCLQINIHKLAFLIDSSILFILFVNITFFFFLPFFGCFVFVLFFYLLFLFLFFYLAKKTSCPKIETWNLFTDPVWEADYISQDKLNLFKILFGRDKITARILFQYKEKPCHQYGKFHCGDEILFALFDFYHLIRSQICTFHDSCGLIGFLLFVQRFDLWPNKLLVIGWSYLQNGFLYTLQSWDSLFSLKLAPDSWDPLNHKQYSTKYHAKFLITN